MVDIHCHILPGIDDGPATLEESIEMVRLAAASGVTDLVATPHANSQFAFDPKRVAELLHQLSSQTDGIVNLHSGCDFHLNIENLQDVLINPGKYTINHGPYLLVELPDFLSLFVIRQQLGALLNARIRPIITHPERNVLLQSNGNSHLGKWIADGCFVQVTAQSFLGRFGKDARRAAESLMNAHLVHAIASDAHDCTDRPPGLSDAYQFVSSRWGNSRSLELFTSNPAAIIAGAPLKIHSLKPRWFNFLA